MKEAFTIVELIIVTAILGILAAVVLPAYRNNVTKAKEAAAKDSLRIIRNAIELYAARNDGIPPGYPGNNMSKYPDFTSFWAQIVRDGKYISDLPLNPFNKLRTINVIKDATPLPSEATGQFGWIYKPATRDFRLDWPGKDSDGVNYYDY